MKHSTGGILGGRSDRAYRFVIGLTRCLDLPIISRLPGVFGIGGGNAAEVLLIITTQPNNPTHFGGVVSGTGTGFPGGVSLKM